MELQSVITLNSWDETSFACSLQMQGGKAGGKKAVVEMLTRKCTHTHPPGGPFPKALNNIWRPVCASEQRLLSIMGEQRWENNVLHSGPFSVWVWVRACLCV